MGFGVAVLWPCAVVLAAAVPGRFAGGETRPWRRRREAARAAAAQAREAAGEAFLRLDSAQRELRIALETVRAVEPNEASREALERFGTLSDLVDEVSGAYIAVMDRHPLDSDDLETTDYDAARRELDAVARRLDEVGKELERFGGSIGPMIARADEALSQLPPKTEQARQAVHSAAVAVETAVREGLAPETYARRLAALREDLAELDKGAATHGVAGTLALAARVSEAAQALYEEAERLPRLRDDVTKRLSSLRTRAQAVASRADNLEPALSRLRQGYSAACWSDLEGTGQTVARAVEVAEARIDEAAEAANAGEWADAVSRLATARAALNNADEAMAAVHDRLRDLEAVARDPSAEIERTRFAVKDAQRLALAGRANAEEKYARSLDALVFRLEAAGEHLDAPHPDWWRFLTETRAIRAEVAHVVQRIRDDRAAGG
jgi:chromosome segregation ATPase